MHRALLLLSALTILAIAAAACGSTESPTPTLTPTATVTVSASASPTAVAGEPGPVMAIVNGEEIRRSEFEARLAQANDAFAAEGTDVTSDEDQALIRSRLLDRMVGEILLLDAAAEAGITADPADVDAQYAESASQFETEQAFLDRLAELHLDAAQFRENIEENIIMDSYVDHYVSNIVPDEELTPTEEELRALYDEAIKEFVGAVPSYEDMLPSLDNELRRRKVGEAIDQLFEDLQAAADIEIYG